MPYTVNKVISNSGQQWHPGDVLPDTVAELVDDMHLVSLDEADVMAAEAAGAPTGLYDDYDGRTVTSVLDWVREDPTEARIAFAKIQEADRASGPRQGVLDGVAATEAKSVHFPASDN